MKRELSSIFWLDRCCPGHDKWPGETYKNRRSKRARARDIKREHRYIRRIINTIVRGKMVCESEREK